MLDTYNRRHRVTVLNRNKVFAGGYVCACSCGQTFPSMKSADEHRKAHNFYAPPEPPRELVQNVNMFPRVEFYWDRYTDEMHPINVAAYDMKKDWGIR